jgi:murein DD-endopeptidase MepM/ murein hydrolase activator NlpD
MSHILRRGFAPVAIALMFVGVWSVAGPRPAVASLAEVSPEPTFEVFPNAGTLVNFWDSWGAPRSGGRQHEGIDIMSPRGTPIRAVADGVVTEMGYSTMSGYFIRVDHEGGWTTVMMHLNNDLLGQDEGKGGTWSAFFPTLMVGDAVTAGQILGYVGDSGNAEGTRPHAHFELRYDGKKVNPYPYLSDAWLREQRFILPVGDTLSI